MQKSVHFFVLGSNSDTPCIENALFCVQFFLESRRIEDFYVVQNLLLVIKPPVQSLKCSLTIKLSA